MQTGTVWSSRKFSEVKEKKLEESSRHTKKRATYSNKSSLGKNPRVLQNVHFSEKGAYKCISGERLPISIRIDKGLYRRFKPLAKRVYGSVCRAVEIHMIAFINAVEKGVHFCNTEKPINIEKIVIQRDLRPRRKLEIVPDVEQGTPKPIREPCCDFCGKVPVVAHFEHTKSGIRKSACRYHNGQLRDRADWVVVRESPARREGIDC